MPTVSISGSAHVTDVLLNSQGPNDNYGSGSASFYGLQMGSYQGASTPTRSLIKLATSQIPAGTLTGFRLILTRYSYSGCTVAANLVAYQLTARSAWVQGTGDGSGAVAGAVCWNYLAYTSTSWGTAGCEGSGVDYVANASPPSVAFGAFTTAGPVSQAYTLDLNPAWATAWRDGSATNNGIVLASSAENTNGAVFLAANTAYGTNIPVFEIDYASGGFASLMQVIT